MKGSRFLFRDLYGLHETRARWGQDYDFIFKMLVKQNFVYTYFHHSQDATKPFLRYLQAIICPTVWNKISQTDPDLNECLG